MPLGLLAADTSIPAGLAEILSLRDAAISAFHSAPGSTGDYRALGLFDRAFMRFCPSASDLAALRSGVGA